MMEFPEEYFQAEEREGFLVDSTMKTVWAAEIEVLNEVAYICAKHGLQWYAAYGTLLGAVRHQGYIPWDDDIDIWMMREDYRKLMEVIADELPEGYVVRGPHSREGYPEYQVYVNNSDSISIEPEHLAQFHGCPFYVGIDIFPLDAIPSDPTEIEIQRSIFSSALLLQQLEYEGKKTDTAADWGTALQQIGKIVNILQHQYGMHIDHKLMRPENRRDLLEKLWQAAEEIPYRSGKQSHQVAMYLDYLKYEKIFETEWFREIIYLPFEGFDLPVPKGYDLILKKIYGNYRKIVRNGGLHDYPCYKKQLEELRRKVEEYEIR